jgi:hypothetical protein
VQQGTTPLHSAVQTAGSSTLHRHDTNLVTTRIPLARSDSYLVRLDRMIQSVTALTLAKANLDLRNEVRVVSVALVQDQVLWVQDQEAALHLATRNGAQEVGKDCLGIPRTLREEGSRCPIQYQNIRDLEMLRRISRSPRKGYVKCCLLCYKVVSSAICNLMITHDFFIDNCCSQPSVISPTAYRPNPVVHYHNMTAPTSYFSASKISLR